MEKKAKRSFKSEKPPVKQGEKNTFSGKASGAAEGSGGSRQGNIGHQSNDNSDTGHR